MAEAISALELFRQWREATVARITPTDADANALLRNANGHDDLWRAIAVERPGADVADVASLLVGRGILSGRHSYIENFAGETKPIPAGFDSRTDIRIVLRVFVLIRLTLFCYGCAWGET
jgi:hypothetical protein